MGNTEIDSLLTGARQANEGAAIALAEHSHEGCEFLCFVWHAATTELEKREADGVYPDHLAAIRLNSVFLRDGPDDRFRRLAAEIVAKYVNTDLLIGGPERVNRIHNAVDRIAIAKRRP